MYDYYNPLPVPVKELIDQHVPAISMCHSRDTTTSPKGQFASCFSTQVPKSFGTFFGPTCDSLDKICEDHPVSDLNIGDWVAFEDMGAYTSAAASRFNGVPLAAVQYCHSLTS